MYSVFWWFSLKESELTPTMRTAFPFSVLSRPLLTSVRDVGVADLLNLGSFCNECAGSTFVEQLEYGLVQPGGVRIFDRPTRQKLRLVQPCPIRSPGAACGTIESFVRPSLGFCCSKSILYTDNLSLFWLSWLWRFWCRWSSVPVYHVCYYLPLQVGFEHSQYINLS